MKINKIKTLLLIPLTISLSISFIGINGISTHAETLNTKASMTSTNELYFSPIGIVTWFNDPIGDNGQSLGPKDCATKASVDNPPDNTRIYLYRTLNGKRNFSTDKKDVLIKNDVGSLPDAILDIRFEEMHYFGVLAGYNQYGSYGSFTGYYYHD